MSASAASVGIDSDPHTAGRTVSVHNWIFIAFVFLMPLQNIYMGYFPKGAGGFNFLNLMVLGSLLMGLRCGGSLVRGTGVNGWVYAYVGVAVLALLIGYAHVSDSAHHANVLKDQTIAVAFIFIAQLSVTSTTTFKRLLLVSLAPLPYMLMVVLNQHSSVDSWHYSHDLRIRGTFVDLGANEIAAFFVTSLLVSLGLAIGARKSGWLRWVFAATAACSALGVVYTYSRTAYVAVLLGAGAIVLLRGVNVRVWIAAAALLVALPSVLPPSALERFHSIDVAEGTRDESTENRFQFWEVARENFARYPLFGSGYHTFHHYEINPRQTDTHNFFLRELTEKGLLGAVVLLGMLFCIGRALFRGLRSADPESLEYGFALGMCGAFLALLTGNLFGDRFTHYAMIAHFWLYVGLALQNQTLRVADTEEAEPEPEPPLANWGRRRR